MRHLSDTEILNWNSRLEKTPYRVSPKYHTHSSFPLIVFYQKNNTPWTGGLDAVTIDPHMNFSFSFSVAKNRVDNFFHIFNRWFTNKIETKTFYENKNSDKVGDIRISNDVVKSKKQEDHKIKDKEYTKFTYEFDTHLSSIMAYVSFLEDTIEIFSRIWGYDENGGEHLLTKFNIGDVVAKVGDQTEEYIILDFSPQKNHGDFIINYEISKMITRGQIIQYSPSELVGENDITWSRNNRIDNILDK